VTFLPPIVNQITFLSSTNIYDVTNNVLFYYPQVQTALSSFGTEKEILQNISNQVTHFLNFDNI